MRNFVPLEIHTFNDISQVNVIPVGSTTPRTLATQAALSGAINVKDPEYGAVGDGTTDDTAAIQAAVDAAATAEAALAFSPGTYKCSEVRLSARSTPWVIHGNGATLFNPETSSSHKSCLYYTTLTSLGSSTKDGAYGFGDGVHIHNLNFDGTGFGVGYKHMVAGQLKMYGCRFSDLQSGVRGLGSNGVAFYGCKSDACTIGFDFPLLATDPDTVNYVAEGTGWADGILLDSCNGGGGDYGFFFGGSTSEGIVTVRECIWTACAVAGIEITAAWQAVNIKNNWFEFFVSATADQIRLSRNAGSFEAVGPVIIEGNHFFNSSSGSINYAIYARCRNLHIKDNTFQLSGTYTGAIYKSAGAARNWTNTSSITPSSTANFNAAGTIDFTTTDLASIGGDESVYYYDDGTNELILRYDSNPDGSTTRFTVHSYNKVYSQQFPTFGANWTGVTDVVDKVHPLGLQIDFDNATTGLTFGASPLDLDPAINGGMRGTSLTIVEDNNVIGVSDDEFYQQSQFGEYILKNNSNQI